MKHGVWLQVRWFWCRGQVDMTCIWRHGRQTKCYPMSCRLHNTYIKQWNMNQQLWCAVRGFDREQPYRPYRGQKHSNWSCHDLFLLDPFLGASFTFQPFLLPTCWACINRCFILGGIAGAKWDRCGGVPTGVPCFAAISSTKQGNVELKLHRRRRLEG